MNTSLTSTLLHPPDFLNRFSPRALLSGCEKIATKSDSPVTASCLVVTDTKDTELEKVFELFIATPPMCLIPGILWFVLVAGENVLQ